MRLKYLIYLVFIPQILWSQSIIEKEITNWEFRMVGDSVWKPAKVPGTIIDNFVDLSNISNPLHPYYGDNEKLYQWIGEKDWEFRTTVNIDIDLWNQGYRYELIFESLDLFAQVYINDVEQWHMPSAFVPATFQGPVDSEMKIRIVFHSTSMVTKLLMQNDSLTFPGGERVYARTPQYQFGWDWGPKFVNMGIRKPAYLRINIPVKKTDTTKYVRIDAIRFEPWKLNTKNKRVSVFLDGQTNCDSLEWHLKVFLNGDSIDGFDDKWHTYLDGAYLYFLQNAQEWWPNGSANKSNYYEFDIRFTRPGDTTTLAHRHVYYALCDIQLQQKKDKKGESFYFTVNGEKVYAKGANYIPDDSFHPGNNTQELIKLAREANMNMIRVWGGGTYPDDDFYLECMKNGIMVWQDYMFACAMYPANDDFISVVQDEAFYHNERLHGYNNIAVWCGNNENEEGWKNWGWQRDLKISPNDSTIMWKGYTDLFHDYLKNAVYDTSISYISTSPKYGWGRKESMTHGDSHYWGVWWGLERLEKYNEKVPRFMSEFGMQGMPDLSTLKKVIPDSSMNFNSPKFKNHQKHPTGFQTIDHYLKEYLVIPDNMQEYSYATQILQAYAFTMGIEAQRRAMPYCMGSLIWQLNDCWPVTSWSIIDSELKTKIAYWEIQKAFEPVHISVKEGEKQILITIINDRFTTTKGKLELEINNFFGKQLWATKKNITLPKGRVITVYTIPKSKLKEFDLNEIYLKATFTSKAITTETFYHFVKPGELTLPPAQFKVSDEGNWNSITVMSNVYAPFSKYESFYFGHLEPGKPKKFWIQKTEDADDVLFKPEVIMCLNQLLN